MREIQLSHGGGGVEMNQLINQLFFHHFGNEILLRGEDAALLPISGPIAFTTDSFTVSPLFFAGGDIGKLAIAGTVNDLAMMGARPEYLSCSFIIEEGFPYADLVRIVESMAAELTKSGARIVCGDTKVVPRGAADKIFINTSGVGSFPRPEQSRGISVRNLEAGDAILVSRDIGSHGACILMARDALQLGSDLKSDCTTLWPQVEALLEANVHPHALRDATRGGLAAVLNEWSTASGVAIELEESAIPVCDPVRGLCELYGFEPYDLANEGTMVLALPAKQAEAALALLQTFNPTACQIGVVKESAQHKVVLNNLWGSRRYLELPQGELLPRIC
ncbi:hydrogenase expression/formation protein HypE [Aeromonas sp. AE23HZ002T15]